MDNPSNPTNMKKILIALVALTGLLASSGAQAQTYYKEYHPNEVSFSYGVSLIGSVASAVIGTAGTINSILNLEDDVKVTSGGSKGVLNLGYSYQMTRVFSLGGAVGFNRVSANLSDHTGKVTAAAGNVYTIMTTGKFDWFRTRSDMFGMYSKVGLGVMIVNSELVEDETTTRNWVLPTGHLSLIGMEVGRGFSGFLELGMGFQGIVQAGIRARF